MDQKVQTASISIPKLIYKATQSLLKSTHTFSRNVYINSKMHMKIQRTKKSQTTLKRKKDV